MADTPPLLDDFEPDEIAGQAFARIGLATYELLSARRAVERLGRPDMVRRLEAAHAELHALCLALQKVIKEG